MARKTPAFIKPKQQEFVKMFSSVCGRHPSWQVWSDFVEMTATAISNAMDLTDARERREKRYAEIIARYTPQEQKLFPDLVAYIVKAMDEDQEQDFLGDIFMGLELGSHWKGQFFTPYDICRAMAEMTCPGSIHEAREKGWISVNDPACGAGALLIASRNVYAREGLGSDNVLFVAQDIDRVAGLMCYIQLSLLGCAGYVVIADSLLYPITGPSPLFPEPNENHDVWYTPMWYSNTWLLRRLHLPAEPARIAAAETQQIEVHAAETQQTPEPEEAQEESPAPPPITFPEVAVGEQLRLF